MDDLQRQSRLVIRKRFGVSATTYALHAGGRFGRVVGRARQSQDRGSPLEILSADRVPTAVVLAVSGPYADYAVTGATGEPIGVLHPVVRQSDTGVRSVWEIRPEGAPPLTGTDRTRVGVVRSGYADLVVGPRFKVARAVLPFDFGFGQNGAVVRIRRPAGLRDRYVLDIAAAAADLDRRLVVAQAIVLGVFEEQNPLRSWVVTRRLLTGR